MTCPPSHRTTRAHTGELVCLTCATAPKRRNKFGAVKVETRLGRADSKKEGRHFEALYTRAAKGEITDLVAHPVFELRAWSPDGPVVFGKFTPDAGYTLNGRPHVDEVKSAATRKLRDYRIRVAVFKANYPAIVFNEI